MQSNPSPRILRASLALAALGLAGIVSAAQITDTFNIASSPTDWYGNTLKTGNLKRFNSALGTLQSVQLSLGATTLSTIKLANLSQNSTATITGNVKVDLTMADRNMGNSHAPSVNVSAGASVTATNLAVNSLPYGQNDDAVFTSASGKIFNNVTGSNSANTGLLTTNLGYYIGSADLVFDVQALDNSTTTGFTGLNGRAVYTTAASAVMSVTYTYAPVPEPGTFAALGLGAVAVLRRRKGGRR